MKGARPGWLLLALAGLAAVFGAFLPFYTYSDGIDVTVWSRGLFPTAALIPLLGAAVGVQAAFVLVRGHEPRSPFLNFTWEQARLAAGAFMILLTLSYLVQDRAGGTLGIGYALLAGSSLATFGGGVLTRRAQLARTPGAAAEREPRPVLGPAIATVSRASSNLAKSVADRSHTMRERLAERRAERAAARREAAEAEEARQIAEMRAAAEAAAAEKAAAEKAAAEEAAQPAPPAATVETLPADPHPPAATLDELPPEEPEDDRDEDPVEPPAPAATAEQPEATAGTGDEQDTEDTAELPLAAGPPGGDDDDDKTTEEPRVAKLSAVRSDSDPDATAAPDGESRDGAKEEDKEKERADTGTEGSPSG